MTSDPGKSKTQLRAEDLILGENATRFQRLSKLLGQSVLILITSISALAVLFIFIFIVRDAKGFFTEAENPMQFFTSTKYYTAQEPPIFGALSIFVGSGLVTAGAILIAVPLGIAAALCLSDVLPFAMRQIVKPIIELLAAIPSVAYGFFALIIFAPLLQETGGTLLAWAFIIVSSPLALILSVVVGDVSVTALPDKATLSDILHLPSRLAVALGWRKLPGAFRKKVAAPGSSAVDKLKTTHEKTRRILDFEFHLRTPLRILLTFLAAGLQAWLIIEVSNRLFALEIERGVNAMNASIILGIMALPTIVSVSEDALSAVGRDMREGSYALGATRAETLVKVVIPAASSGILAAILLGVMRAIGETMVVWMAAGNAGEIPTPWYNLLQPVRTLTATIAGDMGETARGTAHYHALFLMAFTLLSFSFICNFISEWAIRHQRKKLG
jgi:phosphate transport system permease protein